MYDELRQRGKEFNIVFADRTLLSNSRLALEASEYARDKGKYERFHADMFLEYFTEARDIGSLEVILAIAARCDLDVDDMMIALQDGRYRPRLVQARKEGETINLTGVPTFIINEKFKIVGAQPIQVFQETFGRIGN
jgi:predicted DsbA family dithiol-disulfide isomerase